MTDLRLNKCRNISGVSCLIFLRKLYIDVSLSFDDVSLSSLRTLVNLEFLYLEGVDITVTTFRDLSTLTVLKELYLMYCFSLTDDGVRECARACRALCKLSIGVTYGDWDDPNLLTITAWAHLTNYASSTLTHLTLLGFDLGVAEKIVLSRFKLSFSDHDVISLNHYDALQ